MQKQKEKSGMQLLSIVLFAALSFILSKTVIGVAIHEFGHWIASLLIQWEPGRIEIIDSSRGLFHYPGPISLVGKIIVSIMGAGFQIVIGAVLWKIAIKADNGASPFLKSSGAAFAVQGLLDMIRSAKYNPWNTMYDFEDYTIVKLLLIGLLIYGLFKWVQPKRETNSKRSSIFQSLIQQAGLDKSKKRV